jgi:amidophosphoribosyltransferase
MAANHSLEEIRKFLNADTLGYLSLDGMVRATGRPMNEFCLACYTGEYPVKYDPTVDKHIIERRRGRTSGLGLEIALEQRQQRLL